MIGILFLEMTTTNIYFFYPRTATMTKLIQRADRVPVSSTYIIIGVHYYTIRTSASANLLLMFVDN